MDISKMKNSFILEFKVESNLEDLSFLLEELCKKVNEEFVDKIKSGETNIIATCKDIKFEA